MTKGRRPPKTTKTKSHSTNSQPKSPPSPRKRPRTSATVATSQQQPPSPPPPPPRSLISLLETDPDVLQYFQKLQENLHWDVQKWKQRAAAARQQQQPQQEDDETTKDRIMDTSIMDSTRTTPSVKKNKKKKKNPPNDDGTRDDDKELVVSSSSLPSPSSPTPTPQEKTKQQQVVAPSTTIAFSSSSNEDDSDDDDSDDDPDTWFSWEGNPPLETTQTPTPVDDHNDKEDSVLAVAAANNERSITSRTEQKKKQGSHPPAAATAAATLSGFGMHHRLRRQRRRRQRRLLEDKDEEKRDNRPEDDYYSTSSSDDDSFLPPRRQQSRSPDDDDHQQQVTSLAMKHLTQAYQELQDMGILLWNVNVVKEEEILLQEEESSTTTRTSPDDNNRMEPVGVEGITTKVTTQNAMFTSSEEKDGKILSSSSAATTTRTITRYYYQRRSNRDVSTQILLFLKALAKMKHVVGATAASSRTRTTNPTTTTTTCPQQRRRPLFYYPFMTEPSSSSLSSQEIEGGETEASPLREHLPCYQPLSHVSTEWQHPAVKGMDQLLHALVAIDLWSGLLSKVVVDGDDEDDNNNDDNIISSKPTKTQQDLTLQEQVLWGMQGRETLVSNYCLKAWHGEMVETWAIQDRSLRLVAESTHLDFHHNHNPHHHPHHHHGNQTNDNEDDDEAVDGGLPASIKLLPYGHKNHLRFSNLMERCLLMKLATSLYLTRGDGMTAFALLYKYVVSTAPSRSLEDYPRLAPVQSLCVVEAMLTARSSSLVTQSPRSLADWMIQGETYLVSNGLGSALKESFRVTAEIFSQRNLPHMDDRVTDLSKVELAAYQRLMTAFPQLLSDETNSNHNDVGRWSLGPKHLLELILAGDAATIDAKMKYFLSIFTPTMDSNRLEDFLANLSAKRELEIRQWDTYRRIVQTPMVFEPNHTGTLKLQELSSRFVDSILKSTSLPATTAILATAFRVCLLAADGVSLVRLASWCISQLAQGHGKEEDEYYDASSLVGDLLETSSQVLTVRIINLERRPDRLAMFHTQAMMHHLSVLPGVATLSPSWNTDTTRSNHQVDLSWLRGTTTGFAIDGQGKAAEVEGRLIDGVGGGDPDALNALVRTHWYPHELQPFDFDAPKDTHAVLISPSEKACALSHIACWKGVVASLSSASDGNGNDDDDDDAAPAANKIFRSMPHLRQRFLISGYAKGPCLMTTGGEDGMYDTPTPVCLILEDDAMLVDRFSERLARILEELPRDFHVCSLGYSRPKTAPLVPFSDHLSVPTSIWYLTGYLVSLRGAQYLLQHLPVQGPVDSWIGLQLMFTQNWDNSFGHALGVGVSTKAPPTTTMENPSASSMTRKEWQQILRFRAFCATTPLCSQRVGLTQERSTGQSTTNLAAATGGKSGWRQRDTDIVYSGHG